MRLHVKLTTKLNVCRSLYGLENCLLCHERGCTCEFLGTDDVNEVNAVGNETDNGSVRCVIYRAQRLKSKTRARNDMASACHIQSIVWDAWGGKVGLKLYRSGSKRHGNQFSRKI